MMGNNGESKVNHAYCGNMGARWVIIMCHGVLICVFLEAQVPTEVSGYGCPTARLVT